MDPAPVQVAVGAIKFKRLKQTHPRLNLDKVEILQALYKGGQHLLGNQKVMRLVFPKYTYESEAVYQERIARAYYENVFAMVINQISAGLAQDPADFSPQGEEDAIAKQTEQQAPPEEEEELDLEDDEDDELDEDDEDDWDEEDSAPEVKPPVVELKMPELDPYWADLLENATALSEDGTGQRTFDQVVRDICVEAMVTGWGWAQCDLPKPTEQRNTLGEQEAAGDLRAYIVPWPTNQVIDWSEKEGRIQWLRTYVCECPDDDPAADRDTKVHRYTLWDAKGWTLYEIIESRDNPLPNDEMLIVPKDHGTHSFGRTPWIRFEVVTKSGSHLHIGDIIESLCRQYFNRQNGEAFQWTQYNYQQLYEFLGPEISGVDSIVSEAQQDPGRASRRRAPGVVHVRGNEDRAEFIGPNMGGAAAGAQAQADLRDAILRVVAMMALAQDTSGAMLRRSAASKKQDDVAKEILLGAIGKLLLIFAKSVVKLLGAGRKDSEEDLPEVSGYERFEITDPEQMLNLAVIAESANIPSAEYQIEMKYQAALAHLGDNVTPEKKALILAQLRQSITQDQMVAATPDPFAEDDEDLFDDEDAEDDEEDDEEEDKDNPFDA